ncbi:MAG: hypothetical protein JXL80_12060 [Planctomycetes bacterium]|nr:hypothetical protein [Planctomycetota bacterium]
MPQPDDTSSPVAGGSTGEPLADGRPLWQRLVSGGLIIKFLIVLTLVWFTHVRGCNTSIDPPRDVRAVDEVCEDAWSLGPFLVGFVILVIAVLLGSRRRHLLAVTAFDLLRISAVLLFTMAALFAILVDYEPGAIVVRKGMWLGLGTLAAILLIDVIRLIRRSGRLAIHFRRTHFWSRRNLWLMPVVAVNLFVGGASFAISLFLLVWYSEDGFVSPISPAVPIFVAFLLWTACLGLCLMLAAWGLWQRQTWASWTHLYCGLPLVAALLLYATTDWPAVLLTVWYVPCTSAAIVWWLYGAVVGNITSAHWLQRGRCGQCGQVRWMIAARCEVCGERYKLFRDRAAAPACLACGHEQSGVMPTCKACRREAATGHPPSVGQAP